MISLVIYDGVDLNDYNFFVEQMEGIGFMPSTEDAIIDDDSIDGAIDQGARFKERAFSLTGRLVCDTLEDQDLMLRNLGLLFNQTEPKQLVAKAQPDRYLSCLLNGPIDYNYTPLYTELSIPLVAPDPFWSQVCTQEITIEQASHIQFINEGNYATPFIATIFGPTDTPEFYLNNSLLKYTGSLGASDLLVIDTGKKTALFNNAIALTYNQYFPLIALGTNIINCRAGEQIEITTRYRWL